MERIEHTIDINAPLNAVYAQCARFSDYPRFMEGVEEVKVADERHLHWQAIRDGEVREWSSVITERDPGRCLAWHDVDGPHRTFTLSFSSLEAAKTRLSAAIVLPEELIKGKDGVTLIERLERRLSGDLERLKKLLENSGHDWNEWPSTHDPHAASTRSIPVFDTFSDKAQQTERLQPSSRQDAHMHTRRSTDRHAAGEEQATGSDSGNPIVQGLLHGLDQPLSIVRKMSGEMDQLFERLIGRPMSSKWGYGISGRWVPTVEVAQRANEFVVSADLPGVAKQDVCIEIQDDKITIEGERRETGEQKIMPGYRRSERNYGRFYRQLPLPAGVQPEKIRATLLNGVLEIRMPLPPGMGRQGHRIDIEDLS